MSHKGQRLCNSVNMLILGGYTHGQREEMEGVHDIVLNFDRPQPCQADAATTVPIICDGSHASAVALVGCGGPGEL